MRPKREKKKKSVCTYKRKRNRKGIYREIDKGFHQTISYISKCPDYI